MDIHLLTPVTPPCQHVHIEMTLTALEIVNNTQAVNAVKDRSENVVNNLVPDGCYGYKPELIIRIYINECGKVNLIDGPEHVDVYFRDSPVLFKPKLARHLSDGTGS